MRARFFDDLTGITIFPPSRGFSIPHRKMIVDRRKYSILAQNFPHSRFYRIQRSRKHISKENFPHYLFSQSLNSKQTAFGETFLLQAVFNVLMAFLILMLLI